jgi:beta-glucosidase
VTVVDGVEVRNRAVAASNTFVSDPETGEPGIRALLYAADGSLLEERHQPTAVVMTGFDDDLPAPAERVVLRAHVGQQGQLDVGVLGIGDWVLRTGERTVEYRLRGTGTGIGEEMLAPPAESTTMELDESGILELTVQKPQVDQASISPLAGVGFYGLIARPAPRPSEQSIADAVQAARTADVAVVVVGLTEEQETEAVDKTTLALPGEQDALVTAVAGAAKRTVVVVNAATPVLMPWLDQVDAVLWAGLPGQEGGHAIAATLVGDREPAGRLVTTFPTADAATPAWSVTPVDGDLVYDEGTFIGYRGHYANRAPAPAFWLGHGLGYTTWEYSRPELITEGEARLVRLQVTNTGTRHGREVVQVYLQPDDPEQPVRLVGWASVSVEPGASVPVEVTTDPRLRRRWDTTTNGWTELPDGGRLLVARGLGDIRATIPL